MAVEVASMEELDWYDVASWGVEGKGWADTEHYYDRLPARAQALVRKEVWNLSQRSAGLCARFQTDAPKIKARWKLRFSTLAMPHMPATGVSGLDLYVQVDGGWRWLGVGIPDVFPQVEKYLIEGLAPARRAYLLYLPLYNGVESVEIGVPKGAAFTPLPPRESKPVVFYGTSIVQGGCASRPGMCHPAIVGRHLDRVVINLGFSGNGRMEKEVGVLLAELDPAVFVIDCLPNMSTEQVVERAEPLVEVLRQARPRTPIVLVEDRTYANSYLVPARQDGQVAKRAALRNACERLAAAGDSQLHYVTGTDLLGDDDEATVDSSHPTDLGFARMAAIFTELLRKLV